MHVKGRQARFCSVFVFGGGVGGFIDGGSVCDGLVEFLFLLVL